MSVKVRHLTEKQVKPGLYLTDETCLFRVVDVVYGTVELEDCSKPDGYLAFIPVPEVCRSMRLVRPAE